MSRDRRRKARAERSAQARPSELDDSAIRALSKEEIAKLSIDSWEPSLLRRMLRAENKLRER